MSEFHAHSLARLAKMTCLKPFNLPAHQSSLNCLKTQIYYHSDKRRDWFESTRQRVSGFFLSQTKADISDDETLEELG
jgi:hypothetical protein